MADISTELARILSAIYGEDVRGSIHDAIEKINDVSEVVLTTGTAVTGPSSSSTGFYDDSLYLNTDTFELWKCTGVNTWASQGILKGDPGEDGNGIASITKTATSGLVDTYTITYTDGTTDTFNVTNGANGTDGSDGVSVTGVSLVSKVGLLATYRMTFSDGSYYDYTVSDGASGSGTGDMTKAVYDTDNDGIVDAAETLQGLTATIADLNKTANLATVATSGSYNDLSNKPTIPTITDTYSGTSSDGMSGKAVAQAIASVPSGGMLPYLYIDSEAGATVTVVQPDSTTITPTAAGSGHWECELTGGYGTYVIHSVLSGQGDATASLTVDTVKEYHVTDNHYDHTINVTAPNGSTVRVTNGTETYTGTGTGSAQAYVVHTASSTYTISVTLDGNTKSDTITTPATTAQSSSVTIEFGTINLAVDADFVSGGVSISCAKSGVTTITKTAAANMVFRVPETGEYTISATLSGQNYSVNANVVSLSTPVSAELNVYTMYGFHVDGSVSDSDNAVSYEVQYNGKNVENYSYQKGGMDFTNDVFDYGDWTGNEFFFPRPCLISQDYQTKIYLNPDDYTKDVNGNDVTSYLTGASGAYNAMVEWGKDGKQIWYKVVPDATPTSYTVYIADMQVDSDFHAWSFYDANDVLGEHFYTAIYGGSVVSNTLRSLSGKSRMNAQAGATEISYAKANNQNSEEYAWYIDVFADRILINFLLVLVLGSINSDKLGYGNYTGGSSASSLLTTGTGNTKGMFYGKQSNSVVKVFGMENWYADQWRRCAGWNLNSGVQLYKLTYGTADGSSAKGYIESDSAPTNYKTGDTIATNLSKSYITGEKAYSNGALLPTGFGGTSATYYGDACYTSTGSRFALVGGACHNGVLCGAFAFFLDDALSYAYWSLGAALSLKPLAGS